MQDEAKQRGVVHGQMKRIAAVAQTSAETVRKVLADRPGVSTPMRKRVLLATRSVQRADQREKAKIDKLRTDTLHHEPD